MSYDYEHIEALDSTSEETFEDYLDEGFLGDSNNLFKSGMKGLFGEDWYKKGISVIKKRCPQYLEEFKKKSEESLKVNHV